MITPIRKNQLRKPRMIMFDYGNTLIHEDVFSAMAGYDAVLDFAVSNPMDVTPFRLAKLNDEYFEFLNKNAHANGIEVHHHCFFRTLFDRFALEFDVPYEALETIYWDTAARGRPAPGIQQVLFYLRTHGIRAAVVSNISFSAEALAERLRDRLPGSDFEFVVASSEYGIRKPEELLFRAALGRSGLAPEDIWFCGDTPSADVLGAAGVGMYPVLYRHPDIYPETDLSALEGTDYLFITDWAQLIPVIEKAE